MGTLGALCITFVYSRMGSHMCIPAYEMMVSWEICVNNLYMSAYEILVSMEMYVLVCMQPKINVVI